MGRPERVAKLEALLVRVQSRASAPRPHLVAAASPVTSAASPVAHVAPPPVAASAPPPVAAEPPRAAPTFEPPVPRAVPHKPSAVPETEMLESVDLASLPPGSIPPAAEPAPPPLAPTFEAAPPAASFEPAPPPPAFEPAEAPAPAVEPAPPGAGAQDLFAPEPTPLAAAMASAEQGPSRDAAERVAARAEPEAAYLAPQLAVAPVAPPAQMETIPPQRSSGRALRNLLIIALWIFALLFLAYALWSTHLIGG